VRHDHRGSLRIRRYLELFRIIDHDFIGSPELFAIEYFSRMNEQGRLPSEHLSHEMSRKASISEPTMRRRTGGGTMCTNIAAFAEAFSMMLFHD
jgi:hypothetical protein